MPFPSITTNRRLAFKSLAAENGGTFQNVLADFSKWNFATRPSISPPPHVACLTTENTSSWALYVLPELWNPRRAKRDLAAVRSHMHVSDRALISAGKRLESWKPTAYAMSFINFSNIEWCHFFLVLSRYFCLSSEILKI